VAGVSMIAASPMILLNDHADVVDRALVRF
jgi:hypothetical protein